MDSIMSDVFISPVPVCSIANGCERLCKASGRLTEENHWSISHPIYFVFVNSGWWRSAFLAVWKDKGSRRFQWIDVYQQAMLAPLRSVPTLDHRRTIVCVQSYNPYHDLRIEPHSRNRDLQVLCAQSPQELVIEELVSC